MQLVQETYPITVKLRNVHAPVDLLKLEQNADKLAKMTNSLMKMVFAILAQFMKSSKTINVFVKLIILEMPQLEDVN